MWQAMRRLAPTSSVRERWPRGCESDSRPSWTHHDRAARPTTHERPVAAGADPRGSRRRRRAARRPRARVGSGNRFSRSGGAQGARARDRSRNRLDRRLTWRSMHLALRAAHSSQRLAPGRAVEPGSPDGRDARRLARDAARSRPGARLGTAASCDSGARRGRGGVGTGRRGALAARLRYCASGRPPGVARVYRSVVLSA